MRDNYETRQKYARIAAGWINEGSGATLLELKTHRHNPYAGYAETYTWAIRNADGELADIDEELFLELIGAAMTPQYYSLRERITRCNLTVYDHGAGGITILNKRNPLLTK